MPVELVKKIVPNGSAPQAEHLGLVRCQVSNGTSVVQITLDTGPQEAVAGAEKIPDLADGAYLERPVPDDAYLAILLGLDKAGYSRRLLIEVAGHDGKDHKDDAVAIAREILARLH